MLYVFEQACPGTTGGGGSGSGSAIKAQDSTACFKCGEAGHWSNGKSPPQLLFLKKRKKGLLFPFESLSE